jgi:DNA-binding response OmpR family regulator
MPKSQVGAIYVSPQSRQAGTTRTLDSHASGLRKKLGVHGDQFVINVWGVGHRLVNGII